MNKKKEYFGIFLCLIAFFYPYFSSHWWDFLLAFFLLLLFSKLTWPEKYSQMTGTQYEQKALAISASLLLVFYYIFNLIISYISNSEGMHYDSTQYHLGWQLSPVFQVLNEEIVFRAFTLGFIKQYISKKWTISVITAFLFSIFHFVLFKLAWGNVTLGYLALTSLFFFGLICNFLYLKYAHIFFGFALHLAWNLNRFTGDFYKGESKIFEGETFNIFEGSKLTLIILGVVTLVIFVIDKFSLFKKIRTINN